MRFRLMVLQVFVLLIFLVNSGVASENKGERKIKTSHSFKLEYPGDKEELAERTLKLLQSYDKNIELSSPAFIIRNKHKVLSLICAQLSLGEPTPNLSKLFDDIMGMQLSVFQGLHSLHEWQLWDKSRLKDLLASGMQIPGFSYDEKSGRITTNFSLNVSSDDKSNGNKPETSAPGLPIVIDSSLKKDFTEQAKEQIEDWISNMIPMEGGEIHEIVEFTIIWEIKLRGSHRRWFADGVSNYVTSLVMEELSGKERAGQFLEAFNIKKYEKIKTQVDLEGWLAKEVQSKLESPEEKQREDARYAFATYEICELVKRNGKEIIPKIFSELKKSEKSDGEDVIRIIKILTGKDFKERLSAYNAK